MAKKLFVIDIEADSIPKPELGGNRNLYTAKMYGVNEHGNVERAKVLASSIPPEYSIAKVLTNLVKCIAEIEAQA